MNSNMTYEFIPDENSEFLEEVEALEGLNNEKKSFKN